MPAGAPRSKGTCTKDWRSETQSQGHLVAEPRLILLFTSQARFSSVKRTWAQEGKIQWGKKPRF